MNNLVVPYQYIRKFRLSTMTITWPFPLDFVIIAGLPAIRFKFFGEMHPDKYGFFR